MTIIHNEYDCANNSPKGIRNTVSIETYTFGTSTSLVPTTQRPVYVFSLRSEKLNCRQL